MFRRLMLTLGTTMIFFTGCTSLPSGLSPVTDFEAEKYMGKWYEIARLDHPFERNLNNVTAVYTLGENGNISVQNKGFNSNTQTWKEIEGKARFLEDPATGSLKVSFFGPFYSGYHVVELDRDNYSYAIVTGPSRSYLWILSRSPSMDESLYADLVAKASQWGFNTSQLIQVQHDAPAK